MQEIIRKAEVLIEALPYIRTFADKTLVIKYGGQAMVNQELKKSVIIDIILLKYIGLNPILVHGGGAEVTRLMQKVGKEAEFVNGLRVTDKETIELVEMVLVGKINKEIVGMINQYGGKAVGLSGKDSNLIIAQKRPPESMVVEGEEKIVDLGYVGDVVQINPEVIRILSAQGYIPVISTLGVNLSGESLNINADHVAGEMAAALGAEKLMILTDVAGIFENTEDTSSLIATLPRAQAVEMINRGKISQGMIPKVEACLKALEHEVRRTHIVDGRIPHSLLVEIFTDHGIGTMVIE